MKDFVVPEISIEELNVADVITASPCPSDCNTFSGCDNDTCLMD